MSKITSDSVNAFRYNRKFKRQNMEVRFYDGGDTPEAWYCKLLLHGNCIAEKNELGFFISNCGWHSVTTKDRLNGLPNVNIQQRDYVWYLNGMAWTGRKIQIE